MSYKLCLSYCGDGVCDCGYSPSLRAEYDRLGADMTKDRVVPPNLPDDGMGDGQEEPTLREAINRLRKLGIEWSGDPLELIAVTNEEIPDKKQDWAPKAADSLVSRTQGLDYRERYGLTLAALREAQKRGREEAAEVVNAAADLMHEDERIELADRIRSRSEQGEG